MIRVSGELRLATFSKDGFWGLGGTSPVNSLAGRLLASLQPYSPIGQAAELRAIGIDGFTEGARSEIAVRSSARMFQRHSKGQKPQKDTEARLIADIRRGAAMKFGTKPVPIAGTSTGETREFPAEIFDAPGPFSALAIMLRVGEDYDYWIRLSENFDKTANLVAELAATMHTEDAPTTLLSLVKEDKYLKWIDQCFLTEPQWLASAPAASDNFKKQIQIFGLNAFLSWLSRLDVDCTRFWFPDHDPFPIFLPFFPKVMHHRGSENPIKNLVKLLENIVLIECQKTLPPQQTDDWWTRSRLGLQDLLSVRQFDKLLKECGAHRPRETTPFSGCGLAMLVAANAISLLTLRDGSVAKNSNRKKKPIFMRSSDDFRLRYLFWWHHHLRALEAREPVVSRRPWPDWFSRSVRAEFGRL